MPRWLSSLVIVAGFFALVGLALFPRFIEVNVVFADNSTRNLHAPGDHSAPAPVTKPED
ncbi:MAG: hypothetical protein ACK4NP_08120 [Parvularculaceae bacterium]